MKMLSDIVGWKQSSLLGNRQPRLRTALLDALFAGFNRSAGQARQSPDLLGHMQFRDEPPQGFCVDLHLSRERPDGKA